MAHVAARYFCPRCGAPYRAGVHGTEAAEINALGQLEFLGGRFQMPQDDPPLRGRPRPRGKDEVLWTPELRLLPHPGQRLFDDLLAIEGNFTIAVNCLRIVKVPVVEAFDDDDAVAQDVIPAEGMCSLVPSDSWQRSITA